MSLLHSLRRYGLVVVLALSSLLAAVEQVTAGVPPQSPKVRVLIVTGGHGFQAKPFFAMFDAIPDVEVTKAVFPQAASLLNPDAAKRFDVIVLYDMWKGLTPKQHQAFVQLLEQGIGLFALHHTLAAHPQWPEYAKIIGGRYRTQDSTVDGRAVPKSEYFHDQEIDVEIADATHPITQGLKGFHLHDETYRGFDVDRSVRVLLETSHPKSNRQLAWVHKYGNSRVFYLQLGHDRHAYDQHDFRTLVARGIRWCAGRPTSTSPTAKELFNGKDLTGWESQGGAAWRVDDGLLVGRQGSGNAPGDLLTKEEFGDFELTVRYRITWPANSGVWYRYQAPNKTFQADILEYKNPVAWSGSLYCPGKLFIAINKNPDIVDRNGWNTIVIRAVGNRHQIWLNRHPIADVRDDTSPRGKIGFQIHAGDQFGKMKIEVKQVSIVEL